jgi:hypothetical protein
MGRSRGSARPLHAAGMRKLSHQRRLCSTQSESALACRFGERPSQASSRTFRNKATVSGTTMTDSHSKIADGYKRNEDPPTQVGPRRPRRKRKTIASAGRIMLGRLLSHMETLSVLGPWLQINQQAQCQPRNALPYGLLIPQWLPGSTETRIQSDAALRK